MGELIVLVRRLADALEASECEVDRWRERVEQVDGVTLMTDERTIDERLAAYDRESHEGGDAGMQAALGGQECGCYADSGIYEVYCEDHDPDLMVEALRAELVRLRRAISPLAVDPMVFEEIQEFVRSRGHEPDDDYPLDIHVDLGEVREARAALGTGGDT